jgi:glyceraldehyde 3-phosphate dehydrogenase
MAIKVGINGFGRIGRMVFRAAARDFPDIEVVGINDLLEPDYLAYMLEYDSVHGRFKGTIAVDGSTLIVNGKRIRLTAEKDPAALKWAKSARTSSVESTGLFLTKETAEKHLAAGAKKVIMSAPSKDDTPMFVFGVNPHEVRGRDDHQQRVVHDQLPCTCGEGAPRHVGHQARAHDHRARGHRRRRRPWMAPRTRTGAEAAASSRTSFPSSNGRREGGRQGHPRAQQEAHGHVVSHPDIRRVGRRPHRGAREARDVRGDLRAMKAAAEGPMKGVLGYTEDKVVASDFRGESRTSVFDADAGIALDDTFVKVVAWYDNEWGYSCKVLEMARVIAG